MTGEIAGIPLWLLSLPFACMLGGVALLLPRLFHQEKVQARLKQIREDGTVAAAPPPSGPILLRAVAGFGAWLGRSSLVSGKTAANMRATLAMAGFRSESAFSLFLGSKVLMLVLLPILVYLVPIDISSGKHGFMIVASAVFGLLAPEFYIKQRRRTYLGQIQYGLSDALDLMVICVESGLGLEPALERVSREIVIAHPPVGVELELTVREMRIVADRRVALTNMGQRTGLEPLKRLAITLAQTLQYGTPLAAALRVLAAEMRTETMTRFEAKAARLPVLLTVPMILFILPCLFLVVGGPALVQVLRLMR